MSVVLHRLPSVKDVIKLYNLSAKSQLSQNFILDQNVTDKIMSLAKLKYDKSLVVEVGPGPGLLTRSILRSGSDNLVVVEKDSRFMPSLKQLSEVAPGNMKIIQGDMLKTEPKDIWDQSTIPYNQADNVHVVGNLPFGVATPLLLQWLKMMYDKSGLYSDRSGTMTLMFQKEVAERIVAKPGNKSRGRLSIMAQAICETKLLYQVPKAAFVPRPKVDATVVKMERLLISPLQAPYPVLEKLVRILFMKRRKTLRRICLDYDPELFEIVTQLGLDPSYRPEDLEVEHFCLLANKLYLDHPHLIPKH